MTTEAYLIQLMRDVCEEIGIPEETGERAPILEALNKAHNRGAEPREAPAADPCKNPLRSVHNASRRV